MSSSSPDEAAGIPSQQPNNHDDNQTLPHKSDVNVIETVNSDGDIVFYVDKSDNNSSENENMDDGTKRNTTTCSPESSKSRSSDESAVMVEPEDAQEGITNAEEVSDKNRDDDKMFQAEEAKMALELEASNKKNDSATFEASNPQKIEEHQQDNKDLTEPEATAEKLETTDNNDPNHINQPSAKIASVSYSSSAEDTPKQPKPQSRISSFIHQSTPIPNSDSSLRIIRKFINKTSRHFPTTFGGTKPTSFISYLFGSHNVDIPDTCSDAYKQLVDVISASLDENDNDEVEENFGNNDDTSVENENEVVLDSIFGQSGDTMSKARKAVAAFCRLVETWCLETQRIRIVEMGEDLNEYIQTLEQSFYYPLQLVSEDDNGEQHSNHGVSKSSLYSVNTVVTSHLMALALSTAEALVAHGCFDGVVVVVGKEQQSGDSSFDLRIMPSVTEEEEENREDCKNNDGGNKAAMDKEDADPLEACLHEPKFENAVTVLAESIFHCYLDSEEVELSSLKFLLTTGCRTTVSELSGHSEAMLRGSHLLQTIRMCYRVYLSTQCEANKTTARAALRQIVTSAFKRLDFTSYDGSKEKAKIVVENSSDDPFSPTPLFDEGDQVKGDDRSAAGMSYGANFSSFEHKDAYLVLRSLCKLSMKATIGGGAFQNVVVLHNDTMRSVEQGTSFSRGSGIPKQEMMMDPALDSKILALDLLVEILQGTKAEVLQNAGPQLIYAVRNYLCHSLLKNCTSDNNYVVSLSLRLFVPLIRHFRSHLKTEIEAFVTNVFFVILDSKNSTIDHKLRVVILFEEICSDPGTLAEIFLNYDCDLSAVDLFQRIVNTLARVAKIGLHDQGMSSGGIFVAGAGVSRAEKSRQDFRELRLEAMKAVRQVLSSLHESFVRPTLETKGETEQQVVVVDDKKQEVESDIEKKEEADGAAGRQKKSLVQIYDSKKKRREEAAKATLRFNQKPTAGIKFASEVGLIDGDDPADVAQFLLSNKDVLDKTQIGEYIGREPDYQNGFPLKVLHQYLNLLDFTGLLFDDAIKFYLSGFRLPGEAQKIDRIMEKFAERFTTQNPGVFPTADAAFILAFSIIMLNTDLHNPAIKEERRMTKEGFLRNNSGICDGKDLPSEFLIAIFDRIKSDPISLKEDDELREKQSENNSGNGMNPANSGLFTSNFSELDKRRESDYQKERDQILRNTESLLRRKKKKGAMNKGPVREIGKFVSKEDSGLKYEYVIPMFDVTWGPALAVFSTVIESANGTMGTLLSIATDREIEAAAENAASATEICLSGFRLAIRIAALCGNDTARSAYVHALSNFSLLGTGRLLEHRHIRCVQTLLEIARDDGELLGHSWEYVFKALSEISRLNQVHEATVKATRAEVVSYERKMKRKNKESVHKSTQSSMEPINEETVVEEDESVESDYVESFDGDEFEFGEEMDKLAIDQTNARIITDTIPEDISDIIYMRSGNLSIGAIKDFVFQLCRVSRMEIAGYGGHVGSKANDVDLTSVHYRKQHTLLTNTKDSPGRYNQPDIYSLQKLVEVTHYNMDSRPRLIFSEIWSIVSSHLTSTCLHDNAAVAIYAVDSFRQLSLQFLQREELGVFEFQRKFLKPFEAVMSQCKNSSVKEFLLKAIEQIIVMFEPKDNSQDMNKKRQISIRSGWRPILTVIGHASTDEDDAIANLGFSMLTKQLRQSLQITKTVENEASFGSSVPLRADKFVDLIDALLMYTSGPREDKSSISIDHLVTIARYLADENIPLPRRSANTFSKDDSSDGITKAIPTKQSSEELELWWPLLLGLSKSVGDVRPNIRIKGLVTLLAIINQHFFPSSVQKESGVLGDLQTLQLIFKGILTPALEHAETSLNVSGQKIPLPDGFMRFMSRGSPAPEVATKGGRKDRIEEMDAAKGNNWIDTTFDHLMDGSISLALKSLELYKNDILIEEVLAMFNNCLVSDSAILVIRGMKRLHHFVTSDLSLDIVSENTWAAVCHMFRRCLTVRGLSNDNGSVSERSEERNKQLIHEFLQEEEMFPARRYIGSNAAMIIGTILSDKQMVTRMGTRWYMFLLAGLGSGIKAWDRAAAIFDIYPPKSNAGTEAAPPQYAESSLYARKWVIRVLARQLTTADILTIAQTREMLKDEFESLVSTYLKKESQELSVGASPGLILEMEHMAKMICDLLDAIAGMDDADFAEISSLTPTLSACIQINDKAIRTAVHGLLQKIFQSSLLGGNR